jgi:hypothetical protein
VRKKNRSPEASGEVLEWNNVETDVNFAFAVFGVFFDIEIKNDANFLEGFSFVGQELKVADRTATSCVG